jgi:heme oxygenase
MRATTVLDHEAAQHVPVFDRLFAGDLPLDTYALLAAQHYHVYRELEAATAHMHSDPVAGVFVFDELMRLPALEADLRFILGAGWRSSISMLEATQRYCERVREVCFAWPGGFVAHQYTRYLGDLSGGQAIGAAVARTYGWTDGDGTRFYEFAQVDDPRAFKAQYRALLDHAPWDDHERAKIVEEIARAYRHNTELLAALG